MVLIYATCLVNVLCFGCSVSIWSLLLLPLFLKHQFNIINIFLFAAANFLQLCFVYRCCYSE